MTRMRMDELMDLYERDPEFRGYVDRCRKNNKRTVDEMLSLQTIGDYATWLKESRRDIG